MQSAGRCGETSPPLPDMGPTDQRGACDTDDHQRHGLTTDAFFEPVRTLMGSLRSMASDRFTKSVSSSKNRHSGGNRTRDARNSKSCLTPLALAFNQRKTRYRKRAVCLSLARHVVDDGRPTKTEDDIQHKLLEFWRYFRQAISGEDEAITCKEDAGAR